MDENHETELARLERYLRERKEARARGLKDVQRQVDLFKHLHDKTIEQRVRELEQDSMRLHGMGVRGY